MWLQENETESADVYKPSVRETDTKNHVQAEQEQANLRGDFVTKTDTVSRGYRIGEAVCVTIFLLIASGISRVLFSVVINLIGNSQ